LRDYIVFKTLVVKHIKLNGEPFGVLHDRVFRLKSLHEDQALSIELTVLETTTTGHSMRLPQLMISRLTGDSLSAELRLVEVQGETDDVTTNDTVAGIELSFIDTELTGRYRVAAEKLYAWLQPFVEVKSLDEIGRINGQLAFDFSSEKHILSTISAELDRLKFDAYEAANAAVKLKFKMTLNADLSNDSGYQLQLLNGSYIKASSISYADLLLKDSRIYMVGKLATTADDWSYEGGLSARRLAARYDLQNVIIKDVAVRIAANAERIGVSGTFSPSVVPGKLSFLLEQNLVDNSGKLAIETLNPLNLGAENKSLSQLLTPWPYPFDLLSGAIRLTADADWSGGHGVDKKAAKQDGSQKTDFNLKTKIDVEAAGGNVGEVLFSGLSFTHELEILPKLRSARMSEISLMHLDSGVTISNIHTHLAVSATRAGFLPKIIIQDVYGEIFGGSFSGDGLTYDPGKTKNNLVIKAKNIDLAKIIETQQIEGIAATGEVKGVIPIEFDEHGVSIKNGSFINATDAGTIKYVPAAGSEQLKQNVLTGMTLDALKDFRYSYLSAGVNFTPEGLLTIGLKLRGISPALDNKRPVHLNINTEQNLLSLLKSLRYAQGVSDKIDDTVRRQYEALKK
ncbi:MAG: YdbH domain-containing protein, partial [Gammaproteobacteria bacterium]|nr:YdbH domain-containing protein [Gammaproteobacteria bacterium]